MASSPMPSWMRSRLPALKPQPPLNQPTRSSSLQSEDIADAGGGEIGLPSGARRKASRRPGACRVEKPVATSVAQVKLRFGAKLGICDASFPQPSSSRSSRC